jgi:hypothetical protein
MRWHTGMRARTGGIEEYGMNKGITRQQVERVARMYKSHQDADRALGIDPRSFSRLCRRYNIETPYGRRQRKAKEVNGLQ